MSLPRKSRGTAPACMRATRRGLSPAALLTIVTVVVTYSVVARADDAAQASPTDQLAEINVTARRRVEPLQEVPVAVSVLTGAQAAAHNLNDIQDISSEIPTVDFRNGASNKDQDIFIRGIGTITTSPGVEPSVSTVVDGVVYDRPGQATAELLDVDHIEVLRGPQGTLFGKNAAAGVINIVTTEPTADFHGYTDGGWFSGGDEYRVKGGVSGGLAPDLTGLVSGVFSHYGGNVDNLFSGSTANGYERYGGHSKLVYTPDENWKITFAGDFLHSRETIPTGVPAATSQTAYPTHVVTNNPAFAAALANAGVVPSYENTNISNNVDSNARDENGGGSITIDGKLGGGYTLTSITAYRTWLNVQDQDYDQLSQLSSAFPEVEDHGQLRFHQFSEEARIASPKGPFIDYVAGLYYLHADDDEIYQRSIDQLEAGAIVPNSGDSHYGTHYDNYAFFGEGNLNFTDRFRAILGGRLVRDELDYYFQRASTSAVAVPAISPAFASAGSTANYGYTDRAGLQFDVTKDITTYATYSHGYTGPAYNVFFNMAASAELALKPETSNSYEVGIKSLLLDHKVELNLAGFITNFENYQANFTDVLDGALVTRLINAGSVSTKGLEADFALRPLDNLTMSGAGAWTRARITDFNCPPDAATSCNINGQPLPFAPDFKFNVDGSYLVPVTASLRLVLDTDYKWQSKVQYQLTETPDTIQGAYGIWDGSVGVEDTAGHWRVSALVENIADTHYSSYLAHGDLAGVMRWVPRDNDRYAGIEVHKSF